MSRAIRLDVSQRLPPRAGFVRHYCARQTGELLGDKSAASP